MSVILKGCEIEMPHSCDICPFCGCDYTCMNYTADCYGEDIGDYSMCRHEKCNLVEIPEGARLIDAEALYSDIIHRFDYCDDFLEMLEEAPTIFEED